MSRNAALEETSLEAEVVQSVARALPQGWTARLRTNGQCGQPELTVVSPAGEFAAFRTVTGQAGNIPAAKIAAPLTEGCAGIIYMSQYVSAPTRTNLEQAGISYADTTGWVRIISDRPMLAIIAQGATKSPRVSSPSAVTRLNGRGAGRVIQALIDAQPPLEHRVAGVDVGLSSATVTSATMPGLGVRELAKRAEVSPGTVSKTLPTLAADGAITRDSKGAVTTINRRQLLNRWTVDYQVLKSNESPQYFIAPRGVDKALRDLVEIPNIAVTGAVAGAAWLPEGIAPVVPLTQLVVYVAARRTLLASSLGLVPVEASVSNVILLTPQDQAILARPERRDGIPVAPLPIVLADLLTLPGRYPAQAEALMDTLAKTDPAWRP